MLQYTTKGAGQVVILIHGFPNDASTWEGIDMELANYYRVININLPGAGKSPRVNEDLHMNYIAQEIEKVLDREEVSKAILIGHSMGGYVAMECLALFPSKIAGISLVHSLASADSEEKKNMRTKAIELLTKSTEGQKAFLKGMAANLFSPVFVSAYPDKVAQVVEKGMQFEAQDLSNFYRAIMNRNDHRATLKNNPIPIQWIVGTEDTATPMASALEQVYLSNINDLRIYEGVGHMSMLEVPERLINDLSDFCHFCSFYN